MWRIAAAAAGRGNSLAQVSRRTMFRRVFGGTGFELDLETANDVLMRINRSLDPIPLSDGMWASFVAARGALRLSEDERARETPGRDAAIDVSSRRLDDLPALVAKDLTFLLRVERVLRMWPPPGDARPEKSPPPALRDEILLRLAREARRYLDDGAETDADRREVLVPVLRCLAKAAKIAVPAESAALLDIVAAGTGAARAS